MRDRLIELIQKAEKKCDDTKQCKNCVGYGKGKDCAKHFLADFLLANGVIVPPCKVGQTVYVPAIHAKCIISFVITHIGIWEEEIVVCGDSDMEWSFDCFGKTVFLTREEAEKALAERSAE